MGTVGRVNAVLVIQKDLGLDSCSKICLLLAGFQCFPTAVMTTDNDCKAPSHDAVRRAKFKLNRKITLLLSALKSQGWLLKAMKHSKWEWIESVKKLCRQYVRACGQASLTLCWCRVYNRRHEDIGSCLSCYTYEWLFYKKRPLEDVLSKRYKLNQEKPPWHILNKI